MLCRIEIVYNNKTYKCNHEFNVEMQYAPIKNNYGFTIVSCGPAVVISFKDTVKHNLLHTLIKKDSSFTMLTIQPIDNGQLKIDKFVDCKVVNTYTQDGNEYQYVIVCKGQHLIYIGDNTS